MLDNVQYITPKPLTNEAFSAYGDVIQASNDTNNFTINNGFTHRFHDLANIDVNDDNGRALLNIFRSTPLEQPIAIKMMERHPKGSQAFIPLGNNPYLVVVAPAGEFNSKNIEVFIANSDQGVNYHKGTWHHFCLALVSVSDFLVIDRGGEGDNCDVVDLDGSLVITTV
ncbi:ureidoglycolate lyase [Thalassotalea profundi]|uniref:Ureidoglycolate lyase n=1 Tax=Thalassotalea profundi TaxID=2036687 RepID=A0ABQ3IFN6_9GAMM|nr:ureidoglycolate lyase [Thalassotalea profundi]GHE82896.1 ureidoglycolate lyase [Thalassotalea profundi]